LLCLSRVVLQNDRIVGHISFTQIYFEKEGCQIHGDFWGLAPLSVDPEYQRKGLGSELVRNGLARAKELGVKLVVVLGSYEYYSRFGFTPAYLYSIGNDYHELEAFMIQSLNGGEEEMDKVRGYVAKYCKEFGDL